MKNSAGQLATMLLPTPPLPCNTRWVVGVNVGTGITAPFSFPFVLFFAIVFPFFKSDFFLLDRRRYGACGCRTWVATEPAWLERAGRVRGSPPPESRRTN